MQEKNYALFAKKFAETLYQNQTLTIFQTTNPKITSKVGESEKDFRVRVAQEMRENRDESVKKMREKYSGRIAALSEKVRKAQEKMAQKQEKAGMQKTEAMISFGSTIVGALFGRKLTKGTISQAGTSIRRATKIGKDSKDASQAQEDVSVYQQQLQDLETQMNSEISALISGDALSIEVETTSVRPRKSDISVETIALVWWPQ